MLYVRFQLIHKYTHAHVFPEIKIVLGEYMQGFYLIFPIKNGTDTK